MRSRAQIDLFAVVDQDDRRGPGVNRPLNKGLAPGDSGGRACSRRGQTLVVTRTHARRHFHPASRRALRKRSITSRYSAGIMMSAPHDAPALARVRVRVSKWRAYASPGMRWAG